MSLKLRLSGVQPVDDDSQQPFIQVLLGRFPVAEVKWQIVGKRLKVHAHPHLSGVLMDSKYVREIAAGLMVAATLAELEHWYSLWNYIATGDGESQATLMGAIEQSLDSRNKIDVELVKGVK